MNVVTITQEAAEKRPCPFYTVLAVSDQEALQKLEHDAKKDKKRLIYVYRVGWYSVEYFAEVE